jgi:type IV pilus assembly protein PilB
LVNLGVEPYLVAATIRGVLAQRLVRKICPHCKELWHGEDAIRQACGGAEELWMGAGCNRCRGTGFAGRIGIFELLVPNAELLDSISRGDSLQSMRQRLVTDGHWLLRQDGIEKVRNGLTTPEEVLCVTQGNIQ